MDSHTWRVRATRRPDGAPSRPARPAAATSSREALLVSAGTLRTDEVRELALAYRRWRDVMAAAIDELASDAAVRLRGFTPQLRAVLAVHQDAVAPTDLEDATQAIWAAGLADATGRDDPLTDLLREPWRHVQPALLAA